MGEQTASELIMKNTRRKQFLGKAYNLCNTLKINPLLKQQTSHRCCFLNDANNIKPTEIDLAVVWTGISLVSTARSAKCRHTVTEEREDER